MLNILKPSITKRICAILLASFVVVAILPIESDAAVQDIWTFRTRDGIVEMTELRDAFEQTFDILSGVSLALGATSFAFLSLKALIGGDKEMESFKKYSLWIIFATAVIQMLPLIISLGLQVGYENRATPPEPAYNYYETTNSDGTSSDGS